MSETHLLLELRLKGIWDVPSAEPRKASSSQVPHEPERMILTRWECLTHHQRRYVTVTHPLASESLAIKSILIVLSSNLLAVTTPKPSSPRKIAPPYFNHSCLSSFSESMSYAHRLLIHDIARHYSLKSALPKSDCQIIPLTSNLGLVFAFLMCIILHGKASEITLLCSLFQEGTHHRRRYACFVVGVGRIIVNRLVDLETRSRVATTAMVVSLDTLTAPINGKPGNLLHCCV